MMLTCLPCYPFTQVLFKNVKAKVKCRNDCYAFSIKETLKEQVFEVVACRSTTTQNVSIFLMERSTIGKTPELNRATEVQEACVSPCRHIPCRRGPVAARSCVCVTACWGRVHCEERVCAAGAAAGRDVELEEVWQPAGTSCGAPRARWDGARRAAPRPPLRQ